MGGFGLDKVKLLKKGRI